MLSTPVALLLKLGGYLAVAQGANFLRDTMLIAPPLRVIVAGSHGGGCMLWVAVIFVSGGLCLDQGRSRSGLPTAADQRHGQDQ